MVVWWIKLHRVSKQHTTFDLL